LTLSLFSYVATVLVIHVPWGRAMRGTFLPALQWTGSYWATIIAVFGTTISPYLFFWQASQETEEIKKITEDQPLKVEPGQARAQFSRIRFDTYFGMAFSNLVAYCIILAAAATLNAKGVTDVQTSSQAAEALRPIAGRFAFFLFALGIVGTGLLAVPVLGGSAAYAVGEALRWPTGLDRKPLEAKGFYGVLTVATLLGLAINFPSVQQLTHLSPIKALFLVGGDQWGGGGSDHGGDDADVPQSKGDGAVHGDFQAAASDGMAGDGGDASGGDRAVRHLEQLEAVSKPRAGVARVRGSLAASFLLAVFLQIRLVVSPCHRPAAASHGRAGGFETASRKIIDRGRFINTKILGVERDSRGCYIELARRSGLRITRL